MAAVLEDRSAGLAARGLAKGRRGQFVASDELTDKQKKFVRAVVRNGGQQTAAAREAGYNDAGARAWELMQKPHVLAAIRAERQRYIDGDLANIAAGTMRDLLVDDSTPAATRFQAAKWCLEQAGHSSADGVKKLIDEGKSLDSMEISELEAFIRAGAEAISTLADKERRTIDITPDSAQDCAPSADITDVLG